MLLSAAVVHATLSCTACHLPPSGDFEFLPESSAACIGCHDDTVGPDAGSIHPYGVTYPAMGAEGYHEPPDPASGWRDLPLYDRRVECATCHVVHDSDERVSVQNSGLCLRCHEK